MKCPIASRFWAFFCYAYKSLRQLDKTKQKRPKASGNWMKQNENAQKPQAIGRNKMKTPKSLRQLSKTKRKHQFASGNWIKQNENAKKPQAIEQNKTKTSICLRQLDKTK